MTLPWQPDPPDQLNQHDQQTDTPGSWAMPPLPPATPPDRAPFPWQRVPGLAGLPPLDSPARPPSRARLPAPPNPPPALPAPPRLPAPIPPIDRARVARLDRRALAVVLACVVLLLLGAAAPLVWAGYFAGTIAQTPVNPPQINAPAPTLPPTSIPTSPPAPTQAPTQAPTIAPSPTAPPPRPTATPRPAPVATPVPVVPPPPLIQSGPLAAPARLALACGSPASLPFHNTSDALLPWSVTTPPGVLVNGWSSGVRGTIAPGGTLVLAVTERPGTAGGSGRLLLLAPDARLAVTLAFASC